MHKWSRDQNQRAILTAIYLCFVFIIKMSIFRSLLVSIYYTVNEQNDYEFYPNKIKTQFDLKKTGREFLCVEYLLAQECPLPKPKIPY